jgi:hypothetical protein
MKLLNVPTRNTAEAAIFSCSDVEAIREVDSLAYAIINDSREKNSGDVMGALDKYAINTNLWSDRDQAVEELAA